ncbi:glutamine synthetase [Kineococcus xinjiangensis]|uniref:Glutamine synthetase n=1 Tax=Kineococcus xinjiangensis TaxID=512762 RepID=A0A2S6IVU8_9ACTN|nr:glutamine synthetase family protein [Kineococcus xinjiangensis]PPK98360.1 glutamine synthetase [Kineococcus xinjiangensis]
MGPTGTQDTAPPQVVETPAATAPLSLQDLRHDIASGRVETVLVAMTDMQGRLQGKRVTGRYFLEEVLEHGTEACNYLLGVDVEMNTVGGYDITSWDRGYGDFLLRPDLATLRRIPWHPGTALVLCDVLTLDGDPVAPSPRQVLRHQLDRLAGRGLRAMAATELEFNLFGVTYEQAQAAGYRDLRPANGYNIDYSLLGTGRVEPVLRRLRREMDGAGLYTESAKGECNLGQHEVAFRYTDALTTCDQHSVYKLGAKEIAAQEGMSLTFMAKVDQREGNSCHIHLSLTDADGLPVFAQGNGTEMSPLFRSFLAGQLAALRELTLLLAPNINSYKRFAAGSFAPTAVAWGYDNRTCALRVVGHGPSLRMENRVPGGDANPYMAVSALLAAGLHGVEQGLELAEPTRGNAYTGDAERVPTTLREAAELFSASRIARDAFGDEVVDHYTRAAQVEVEAFDAAVTDWERARGFERL